MKVELTLNKRSDFYNEYSKKRIKKSLYDYLYNETITDNYKEHVTINIYTDLKIDDEEKREMIDAIRRSYGLCVQDELSFYEINQRRKINMFLLGLIFIIIYYSSIVSVLREIILILGWLNIWESVYSLIFDSHQSYVHITRLKNLSKARIYILDNCKNN